MKLLLLGTCLLSISHFCIGQTTPLPDPGARAMELVWFSPEADPGKVERMQPLEVGFRLPASVERNIEAFIKERPVPRAINPFDPEDLDITAYFERVDKNPDLTVDPDSRHGFFYEEFRRNMTAADPNDWYHEKTPTLFPIRVRYTPEEDGLYRCWVMMKTKEGDVFPTDTLTFEVLPSERPGFVRVGKSKRFLVQDSSTFFPVGQNLPWPACHKPFDPMCEQIKCAGSEAWCGNKTMGPYGYEVYLREMAALKYSGANYFRMLVAPWNLEIEFEKLNNYADRLHCAWEMDQILKHAEDLDLYIHFNLQVHYPWEDQSIYGMWDWDYGDVDCYKKDDPYCYYDELDLKDPVSALTDPRAIKHYQNRLRYMIARYGYSPNIAVLELLSEANNFGQRSTTKPDVCQVDYTVPGFLPYHETPDVAAKMYAWQDTMCRFIKEDLGHTQHITAVSYTGPPEFVKGDSIYYSPHVDLATYNYYNISVAKFSGLPEITRQFQTDYKRKTPRNDNPPAIGKPLMMSEIGPGLASVEDADGDMRWIKAAWTSSFSGMSGTAINWSNQYRTDLWPHLGRIRRLMQDVNLDAEGWNGVNDVRDDKKADLIALQCTQKPYRAMGVIHNRTVNMYTRATRKDAASVQYMDSRKALEPEVYYTAQNVTYGKRKNRLELPNMGAFVNYTIEWYDINTGKIISKTDKTTGLSGKLELEYPTMQQDGAPLIYFRTWRSKKKSFAEPLEKS